MEVLRSRAHKSKNGRGVAANEDGAAAVEFALVLVPFLLLVFGLINWGVILSQQVAMNSAVRDATRLGVVLGQVGGSGSTCQQVIDAARNSVSALNFSPTNMAVAVQLGDGSAWTSVCQAAAGQSQASSGGTSLACGGSTATNNQLQVSATYVSKMLAPIIPPKTMTLTASGQFECEYS
jgi:Flp pilus assembly protein TadG